MAGLMKHRFPVQSGGGCVGTAFPVRIHQTHLMENPNSVLAGYTDHEKGAYLGAIASIAASYRPTRVWEASFPRFSNRHKTEYLWV